MHSSTNRRAFIKVAGLASLLRLHCNVHAGQPQSQPKLAIGRRAVVATVNPIATQAAIEVLTSGGNAIDAAVAASLMLSVVDPYNSGLGGGGLALIRLASGRFIAIDGRETAPSRSQPEQYLGSEGKPDSRLSQEGPRAVAVPGLPALLEGMAQQFGKLPWSVSLDRAAHVAESGFALSGYNASIFREQANKLRKFSDSAGVFLNAQGQALRAGEVLKQPDLAKSLRHLKLHGTQWFYRGEFAERLEQLMVSQGGFMRADDLAAYRTIDREVVGCTYRGHSVYGFPPPSSGGIHIAQMLAMLQRFPVSELFQRTPAQAYHLLLEVMKLALADRAHWLGDADHASVPRGLLDPEYLQSRSDSIDLTKATPVTGHGVPPGADIDLFGQGGHTTHLTTADAAGNVVALTQTINTSFGSKMVLTGTGIVLNNEMDDFSLAPGVRNAFGLVGSAANAVAPNKRPLSSMSPAIVVNAAQQPIFSCGAAGGPRIITTVLQNLVRAIDLQMSPEQILAAPRVHHQWSPDEAVVEESMPAEIVEQLKQAGHNVVRTKYLATSQALAIQPQQLSAAADPRVPGLAQAID